jgi:hypothetical protein
MAAALSVVGKTVVRNTHGRPDTAPAANGTPAICVDISKKPAPCDVRYWGGHVISNVKIYAVFWTAGVDATIQGRDLGDWIEARADIQRVGKLRGTCEIDR